MESDALQSRFGCKIQLEVPKISNKDIPTVFLRAWRKLHQKAMMDRNPLPIPGHYPS
jgi:hypothetical protein